MGPDGRWSCRYRPAAPTASSTSSPFDGGSLMNRARPQSNLLHSDPQIAIRQRWMGVLARAGSPFNLGEMSVTRCVVRLADGRTGYSYVAGRDKQHAELAALADAHLQGSEQPHWLSRLIEPLAAAQHAQQAAKAAETATTQVEFFTLVRGED